MGEIMKISIITALVIDGMVIVMGHMLSVEQIENLVVRHGNMNLNILGQERHCVHYMPMMIKLVS